MHPIAVFTFLTTLTARTTGLPTSTPIDLSKRDLPSYQNSNFISTALNVHNSFRAQHSAGPLVWDNTLAAAANNQASGCSGTHTPNNPYGENLFGFGGTNDQNSDFVSKTKEAVTDWYNEYPQYPNNLMMALHYTQLVWKSTTRIGCAWSHCGGNMMDYYFYCEYSTAGNMMGSFDANVS